ncbi:MAG: ribbon-helix-helix domain-containing protein [Thermoanaerobaculaceae bacterium]|jgi:Arc/MetJ-type ribon-helix-helix transcriptional regulator|nr:ribbon-helix-helix domain-containing protein [Thermoanaerobaculaceae bacterium]
MGVAKIAISLDQRALAQIDQLVRSGSFPSRSRVIQEALAEKLDRIKHGRLARECAKLDPVAEKALAEEGMGEEVSEWPQY